MAERKKLGEMLIEAGLIDDFQLQSALSHQRSWGGKLGSILIDMDFVREEDLARVIAEKLRIPHVNLFEPEVPEEIIKKIKPDIAKKYGAVPVRKEAGSLLVAMSDPLDIAAIDVIQFATGMSIKSCLALESEIKDAIRKYYDHEDVIRTSKPPFIQETGPSMKMEIIRGSDLGTGTAGAPATAPVDERHREFADYKLRLDALISLLLEKDLITRDELVKMIYQKKIGL